MSVGMMLGRGALRATLARDGRSDPDRLVDPFGPLPPGWTIAEEREGACRLAVVAGPSVHIRVIRIGHVIGAGDVRLDNRVEWRRRFGWTTAHPHASDLALVVTAIARCGAAALPELVGDFAVVVYDGHRGQLFAACDVFGLRPLFHADTPAGLHVSSHASFLRNGAYDGTALGRAILGGVHVSERTVYAGVRRLLGASVLHAEPGRRPVVTRYWRPEDALEPVPPYRDAVERFRTLFIQAVDDRLSPGGETWCELSGGTDSSSIVGVCAQLASSDPARALGGTYTSVDTLGEGDERPFVDAVVRHTGVPNTQLMDDWPWRDDGEPPPRTDLPFPFFSYYARERAAIRLIQQAGGRVLLSGIGADQYLAGNLYFLADLIARGRVAAAVRHGLAIACARRTSVWRLLRRQGLSPLLPPALRYALAPSGLQLPPWLESTFVRRHDLRGSLTLLRVRATRRTSRFLSAALHELDAMAMLVGRDALHAGLDMRYPFLDRRLVTFSLSLPFTAIVAPDRRKVIQRDAMEGILPAAVRSRSTKGGIDARILWALRRERPRIDALLEQPILADLGCVEPRCLREAVDAARQGRSPNTAFLLSVLSLESWLAVHHDRWPVEPCSTVGHAA